jgi:hypothetical protein
MSWCVCEKYGKCLPRRFRNLTAIVQNNMCPHISTKEGQISTDDGNDEPIVKFTVYANAYCMPEGHIINHWMLSE